MKINAVNHDYVRATSTTGLMGFLKKSEIGLNITPFNLLPS
jgi:hypothetical protein